MGGGGGVCVCVGIINGLGKVIFGGGRYRGVSL